MQLAVDVGQPDDFDFGDADCDTAPQSPVAAVREPPVAARTPQRERPKIRKGDGWRAAVSLLSPVSERRGPLTPRPHRTQSAGGSVTPRTRDHRRLRSRLASMLGVGQPRAAARSASGEFTGGLRRRRDSRNSSLQRRVSFDHIPRERGSWGVAAPGGASAGTGPAAQPPARRPSREGSILQKLSTVGRAVGIGRSQLVDGSRGRPLAPAATGSYMVVVDLDGLFLSADQKGAPTTEPLPGVQEAIRSLEALACELVMWTSHGREDAGRAAAALGSGPATQIVYNHRLWFRERVVRGNVVYARPALLKEQQAARSDSLEHVILFDSRMDAVRGYRQNVVLVDRRDTPLACVAPSIVVVVQKLVRRCLSVPEFLCSQQGQELLPPERWLPLTAVVDPGSPPVPIQVPVLRPTPELAKQLRPAAEPSKDLKGVLGGVLQGISPSGNADAAAVAAGEMLMPLPQPPLKRPLLRGVGEQAPAAGCRAGVPLGEPVPLRTLGW
eukprot:TRINITY_DN3022_c0_g1_i2.p1 TRINITY_DN3022_c0_g1~~TRINITY_DN3022_c0_g1_i2.p1  ORF type:complete len:498 (+),score=109.10 TRINITY_DN3022_c0_g1_i2:114-1607(+)